MGLCRLPESKKLITKPHHIGIGDIFQPQIEGICKAPTGLLTAKDTAIKNLVGLFLSEPTFRADKTIGEGNSAILKPHRGDHSVAIEGVVNPMAVAF